MPAFPRIYSTFAEFEREELRKLDSLRTSIDDMLDEAFADELDFESEEPGPRRGRGAAARRRRSQEAADDLS